MTAPTLTREMIVAWLQETPELRTCEVAALANRPMKYLSERLRVMELDGYIVRGPDRKIGRRQFATWMAADPQPPAGKVSEVMKRRRAKRKATTGRSPQYEGQIVVLRAAPRRDVVIVGQALAQRSPLELAWLEQA